MQIPFFLYEKTTKKVNKASLHQLVLTKSMLYPTNHSSLVYLLPQSVSFLLNYVEN